MKKVSMARFCSLKESCIDLTFWSWYLSRLKFRTCMFFVNSATLMFIMIDLKLLDYFSSAVCRTCETCIRTLISGNSSASLQRGWNSFSFLIFWINFIFLFRCTWLLFLAQLSIFQAMESCPRANITDLKNRLHEENLYLITEVIGVSDFIYTDWNFPPHLLFPNARWNFDAWYWFSRCFLSL